MSINLHFHIQNYNWNAFIANKLHRLFATCLYEIQCSLNVCFRIELEEDIWCKYFNLEKDVKTYFNYVDVIMGLIASQIISLTIVYWTVYSDADKKNHQALRQWPLCGELTVNSPHRWPVTWKMLPFYDVIVLLCPCLMGVYLAIIVLIGQY